jgi:hypothetical protein
VTALSIWDWLFWGGLLICVVALHLGMSAARVAQSAGMVGAGWGIYTKAAAVLAIGAGCAAVGFAGPRADALRHPAPGALAGVSVPPFVGLWVNENSDTHGITQVLIALAGPGAIELRVWGRCHPRDCDWGKPENVDLTRAGAGAFDVVWHPRFAVKSQRLDVLPDGRLQVVTHTHFTDRSKRADYTATEFFKRQ